MKLIIIYTIVSFLLDGLISNYTSINLIDPSYFRTIYTIVSLVIIFAYFDNHKKYIYFLIILGLLFDIVYTNTFILNIFIFFIIYLILTKLDYLLPNNVLTTNLKSLIAISSYHLLTYLILILTNYSQYNIKILIMIITRSIIMTIIYTTISYYLIGTIFDKIYDKKIR